MAGKKRGTTKKHDKKELVTKTMLKRAITANQELRALDIRGSFPIVDTGSISSLSDIVMGANPNERQGNVLNIRSFLWRAWVRPALGGVPVIYRVIFFRYKNKTSPLPSDILESDAGTLYVTSPIKLDNERNIHVFSDRTHILKDADPLNYHLISRKMNFKIRYDEGSGVTPARNKMYILFISNVVSLTAPVLEYWTRIRFTDS